MLLCEGSGCAGSAPCGWAAAADGAAAGCASTLEPGRSTFCAAPAGGHRALLQVRSLKLPDTKEVITGGWVNCLVHV